MPGVHGHHSGDDRSGAFRRVPGIEQKMLEDVTGEGAMRLEEAIRRKRDDERQSRRGDGGGSKESHSSCSIWWFQFVVGGETRAFAAQES